MKKFALLVLLLLFPAFAFTQTIGSANVTATGNFTLQAGQTLTMKAQIVGCSSGQVPIYQGNPISNTPNQTASSPFTANGSEVVSFTVPGNDQILCGGQNYTLYATTWLINGFPAAPTKTYRLTDGTTTNLNTATAIGFVPPILQNSIGSQCAAGYVLNGYNKDFTPICQALSSAQTVVSTSTTNSQSLQSSLTAPSFIGPLTGTASGNLPLAGGTLTGPLTLPGDPTISNQAATKHYVDTQDASLLPLAGGTLSGALTAPKVNGVYDYCSAAGMHCDGVTDDTAAFNALLLAVYTAGGGTIRGTCGKISLISGQITFPNDGLSFPTQKAIRIEGCGSSSPFSGGTAIGAFTLDMRDNAAVAKILTEGRGTLEIGGVQFVDGGTDCAAFLFDSNTTLYLHDNLFQGTASGASACNNAVILGGTDPSTRSGSNASFQGYGTVVRENTFDRIKIAVLGQNWANNIVVRDNAITSNSGNPTGPAIEFSSTYVAGYDNGLSGENIEGNVIETPNYEYGIVLGTAGANGYSVSSSYLAGNNCYDHGGGFSTCVYIQGVTATSGGGNTIVSGMGDPSNPYIDVSADTAFNTFINGLNGQVTANLVKAGFSLTTPKVITNNIFTDGTVGGFTVTNAYNGEVDFTISNAGASVANEVDFDFADQSGVTHTRIRDIPDGTGRDTYIQNNANGFLLGSLIYDGTAAFGNAGKTTYLHGSTINFDSGATFNNGPTPIYNQTGSDMHGHIAYASGALSSGSATVTWTGSAVFTANMTCTASDETAAAPIKVYNNSGSSVTLTGTGSDQFQLVCVGN